MDKRSWVLTLESSDQVGVFGSTKSLPPGFTSTPNPTYFNNRDRNLIHMFPLTSARRDDHVAVSPPELDLFSGKYETNSSAADDGVNRPAVKKESNSELETGLHLVMNAVKTGSDQSMVDDGLPSDLDDRRTKIELAQLRVELERMNAENERLRGMLSQVGNNYAALQMQFVTLMKQPQISQSPTLKPHEIVDDKKELVPRQFLDLSPGGGGGVARQVSDEQSNSSSEERTQPGDDVVLSGNKRAGPDESPEPENWASNKSPKLNPTKPAGEQSSSEATMRKARVSVRARSEAPMISDGCQWRKYGQKMAKGNPCPRAYYRCTMAVGCPVRKQVQRCAEDQTILITTYEGTHNHPLPPAAMAMASTTSAAATMLLSGSMSSPDTLTMHPNFLARTMLPCSSNMATISASAPFPTITLDLTQSPNSTHFQQPSPPQFPGAMIPQFFGQAVNYNQSRFSGLQMSQFHQGSEFQAGIQNSPPSFADTLSAATAAITKDPNFTAALAAAISSVIGGGQTNSNGHNSTNGNPNVNTIDQDSNNN